MFARLASLVTRHWLLVLLAWLVILVGLRLAAPSWNSICQDGDFAYLPERMTSCRGENLVQQAFPEQASKSNIVLVVARQDGELRPEDKKIVDRLLAILALRLPIAELSPEDKAKLCPEDEELCPEDREIADRLAEKFAHETGGLAHLTAVHKYNDKVVGRKLFTSPNRDAALVVLELNTELMAIDNIPAVQEVFEAVELMRHVKDFPPGLELGVTGSAAVGSDMLCASGESVDRTEKTTIALVIVILLVVYRAPGLAIIPLLAVGLAFFVSTDLIAMLAGWSDATHWFEFRVFKTTEIFIIVILFGAATDYCLFLIARYREELHRGLAPAEAIREALARTGHALTASAMTTILGLGAMVFADFGKYHFGGPTIALSLVVALAACLTAAPALLRAVGRAVFWPFGVGAATTSPAAQRRSTPDPRSDAAAAGGFLGRFWQTVAHQIVKRPGVILVGSFCVLAAPACQGVAVAITAWLQSQSRAVPACLSFAVPPTYDLLSEMSAERESVKGTQMFAQYFPVGGAGPITFLAYRPGYSFDTPDQLKPIRDLTQELADFEYVDSQGVRTKPILHVRSLTNPLGDPLRRKSAREFSRDVVVQKLAKPLFLSLDPKRPEDSNEPAVQRGEVLRFDLVCQYDPFSRESMRLLSHIEERIQEKAQNEDSPWYETTFDFIGPTAGIRDLEAVNTSDAIRIGILVSLAVLGVLIFLLRRPLVSLYLIFTVLFGFFVSLGLTQLFFAWFYGDTFQGLDWKLPVFLFVILVAVGEDYNIYLVTRVFEEQRRWGILEGLRVAVARTGGIITSCGVIMAGTFASMLTGTLRSMFELGFSLALGVLLDTFIIRTILVPAFLAVWDRRRGPPAEAEPLGAPHFETEEPATRRTLPSPIGR